MTTPTAPAGCISLVQNTLRTTLADSTNFRTLVGASDQAGALARIYQESLPAPAAGATYSLTDWTTLRPYAIVATDQHNGIRKSHVSTSAGFDFLDSGRLWLLLAQAPAAGVTAAEADLRWKNAVGSIMDELCGKAGQPGYLAIEAIELALWGRNTHEDAAGEGEEQIAILSIEWGNAQ
jgi:hypothetical protein